MLSHKYHTLKQLNKARAKQQKYKILDIGCGSGHFLNYMRQKGYAVLGVESQSTSHIPTTNFNLKVLDSEDFLTQSSLDKFDYITLWHVLEHLHDLQGYFDKIKEALKPDGYLIIALPNVNSIDASYFKTDWEAYDVPRHLWHFSPITFQSLADSHNFQIKATKAMPLDPFYNVFLSQKYKSNFILKLLRTLTLGTFIFIKQLFKPKCASSIMYILQKQA